MLDPDYGEVLQRIQDVYASCSVQEQLTLTKILEEVALKGYSETFERIWLADFKEVPVSIDRFVCDSQYMGHVNRNGDAIYPYWRQFFRDIFNAGNKYNEIILTGSTRVGKTSSSIVVACYMLYRLMLYRNPHEYFKKKEVSRFSIIFANLTKELAMSVAYREFNDTLRDCPWFMERGRLSRSERDFYYIPEGDKIEIIPVSDAAQALGKQTWLAIMDETNFAKSGVKDINKAKQHMKGLYDTINARISGTFRLNGEVYGKLIAASSKNQDNDFLSDHIEKQMNAGNEHLYIVDKPQWEILPKEMFSDKVFHFTVGDRYKRGFVIPEENDDEEHRKEYESQGFKIIEAPAELRKNFLADYDISLRDIAGISVAGAMGFITQESITPCVAQDRHNPFYQDILVIGKDDDLQIADFFHDEVVPAELKYQRIDIHLDMGETQNRTGISGCCVSGNKIIETEEGKKVSLPFIKQVFSVAVEAPRASKQSFQKVINFILYLRRNHYNIGKVTADAFQSDFMLETLGQQGFETGKVSVERSMEPYIGLRNLLIDQRIELVKNQLQEDELVATQRINNKISHPIDEGGGHGDLADSLAASAWDLITEQVTARPPAKSIASIVAAVNGGRGSYSPSRYTTTATPSTNKGLGAMFAGKR